MANRNYFIVDGKEYYTGTVFIVNDYGKQTEASFICYDIDRKKYIYKIKDCTWQVYEELFWKNFVSVTDKNDSRVRIPVTKTRKDSEIDGLFIGWIWYIFLMAISSIFKGAVGLWILISVVFFSWRHDKIKKEGTYIEW